MQATDGMGVWTLSSSSFLVCYSVQGSSNMEVSGETDESDRGACHIATVAQDGVSISLVKQKKMERSRKGKGKSARH